MKRLSHNTKSSHALAVSIGRRVLELRIGNCMSQVKLAKLAGISQSEVSQIELGRKNPSIRTLLNIAEAIGVDVYQLLY